MDLVGWPWSLLSIGTGFAVVIDLTFRVLAMAVVSTNRRPSSAVAWILAIFFIPFVGLIAYVVIGSPKLPKRRRTKQRRASEWILAATAGLGTAQPDDAPPWLRPVTRMNRNLGALPLMAGGTATLHSRYAESLAAMTAEIDHAREYVHAEFYILSVDETTAPFFEAVERAVARGVVVRILFDHLASLRIPGYRATTTRLDQIGALWHPMLSVNPLKREYLRPDLRNHRKILVVDGLVAFAGSQNLIDARYGKRRNRELGREWVDIMVRFTGASVLALDSVFRTDWYSETDELLDEASSVIQDALSPTELDVPGTALTGGDPDLYTQVVPSGPGFDNENNLMLFNSLIYAANESVVMISPYFVPDESLLMAVTTAAHQGLSVELFVSERGDQWLVHHAQRSYYQTLLDAGVVIWEYPQPYVLHAKTLSIDGRTCVVGSSNMDMRSFLLNLEVSVLIEEQQFADQLAGYEEELRLLSRQLSAARWRRRPWRDQIADGVARLASALV